MASQDSEEAIAADGPLKYRHSFANPELILPTLSVAQAKKADHARIEPLDVVHVEEELMRLMSIPHDFLTQEEVEVLEEFCGDIARIRRLNDQDATREYAVKFLMARKFNPGRAFKLYQEYKKVRHTYAMDKLEPTEDPLYSELATGKFTFLERQENGEAIGIFDGALYQTPNNEEDMKILMTGLLFNIDEALRCFDTIACGMTIMINLRGAKPSKEDRLAAEVILDVLQDQYPARVKRIFVIDAPWYVRKLFRVMTPFLKPKMRERVFLVSRSQLLTFFSPDCLPVSLGGTRLPYHAQWLTSALHHYNFARGYRPYAGSQSAVFTQSTQRYSLTPKVPSKTRASISETPVMMPLNMQPRSKSISVPTNNSLLVAVEAAVPSHDSNCVSYLRALHRMNGFTLEDLYGLLDPRERNNLFDEFSEVQATPASGTFQTTKLACNASKNRYADTFCMESTRVQLNPIYSPNGQVIAGSDYIHASLVGGLHQAAAYILTQSPLDSTVGDFWRLVWEQNVQVIVMCNNLDEVIMPMCKQYWPKPGSIVRIAGFSLRVLTAHATPHWTRQVISMRRDGHGAARDITHLQLTTWSDKGTVKSSIPMIQVLLDMHRINDVDGTKTSHSKLTPFITPKTSNGQAGGSGGGGDDGNGTKQTTLTADNVTEHYQKTIYHPILVHCNSGVGRSAALVAADICCMASLRGMVDVVGTVCFLRTQRAQSIQAFSHYQFIYQAVVEFGHLLQNAEERDEIWDALLTDMPDCYSGRWDDEIDEDEDDDVLPIPVSV